MHTTLEQRAAALEDRLQSVKADIAETCVEGKTKHPIVYIVSISLHTFAFPAFLPALTTAYTSPHENRSTSFRVDSG